VPEIVTSGWLTIDDIVLPNGFYERKVLGGGALYSAVGARIWVKEVGVHSVTGEVHLTMAKSAIRAAGLDASGVKAISGRGLELWLLHESDSDKQQVPKLASSRASDMDEGKGPLPSQYSRAQGIHVAPQTPRGSFSMLAVLATVSPRPLITLDILADAYVDASLYSDLSFLDRVTAFLPSREEVNRLWRPDRLEDWVHAQTERHGCALAVKMAGEGSLVCAGAGQPIHHVPALPVEVLDTTGAGDAFCGGFLAGLIAGRPVTECAAMATVSASYVVEAVGALNTRLPDPAERADRLEKVMNRITTRG
jgi:sugar/nucleoside kinase (ribokinase family)